MNKAVLIQPGTLPPFWNRNAIYFANLLSLFYGNNGETDELVKMVGGLESYGGRLLPIINLVFKGDNLLVLEKEPDKDLKDYFTDVLNISLPQTLKLPHGKYMALSESNNDAQAAENDRDIERLKEHPSEWIDGFVTDTSLARVAGLLGKKTIATLEGSKRGNNKLLLHQFLEDEQLPRFDTYVAGDRKEIRRHLDTLKDSGYTRAVLKSQIGASGIGMIRIGTESSTADLKIPDYIFFEGPCLVQGWMDDRVNDLRKIGSPSVQMFLSDDSVYIYDLTEQILSDDSVHEGNMAIPSYIEKDPDLKDEILELGSRTGQWLHDQGYRGTASADFLVIEQHGNIQVITCEINARITGATYPSILARHTRPEGAWLMRNMKLKKPMQSQDLIDRMDRAGFLYHGNKAGILPINFNSNESGEVIKGQFLCLADKTDECIQLLTDMEHILPETWMYDRD